MLRIHVYLTPILTIEASPGFLTAALRRSVADRLKHSIFFSLFPSSGLYDFSNNLLDGIPFYDEKFVWSSNSHLDIIFFATQSVCNFREEWPVFCVKNYLNVDLHILWVVAPINCRRIYSILSESSNGGV